MVRLAESSQLAQSPFLEYSSIIVKKRVSDSIFTLYIPFPPEKSGTLETTGNVINVVSVSS